MLKHILRPQKVVVLLKVKNVYDIAIISNLVQFTIEFLIGIVFYETLGLHKPQSVYHIAKITCLTVAKYLYIGCSKENLRATNWYFEPPCNSQNNRAVSY